MNEFYGTKGRIFDAFIEMTGTLGYEKVTVRDIAVRIGVSSATVYHYYRNKGAILKHAYEYFLRHYFDNRTPFDKMIKLIETGDAEEIFAAFFRSYESEDNQEYIRMMLINKIVYMRLFQDKTAREMFVRNNADDTKYLVGILQHGIDIGRIYPDFDIETFAFVLVNSQVAMGIDAYVRPDYTLAELVEKKRILEMLSRLFKTGLIPPTVSKQAT